MLTVEINVKGIEEISEEIKRKIERFTDLLLKHTVERLTDKIPVRTGRMRESVYVEQHASGFKVGIGAPYAVFVEYGTAPHMIYPVHAKALRFEVGGEIVFAKSVFHPGTQAQWIIHRTTNEIIQDIEMLWEQA